MKNKVYYFSKINNFLIKVLPYIIPLFIGLAIIFKFNQVREKLTELFQYEFSELQAGVILIITEASLSVLIKIIKEIINVSSFIKHKLYTLLRPALNNVKFKILRFWGNKSINSFYNANYIPTYEQKKFLDSIYSNLSVKNVEDLKNEIFWIQGDSCSGKTTIISNILINIISKKQYYKFFKTFDNKIIYIDLYNDNFINFIKSYNNSKYEKNILIIDNTYILSKQDLLCLINALSSSISAKLIIVCMRDFYESTNDIYFIEELKNRIESVGKTFFLPNIQKKLINRYISYQKELDEIDNMSLYTKIHFINMLEIYRQKSSENIIYNDILDYLHSNIHENNFNQVIIYIISCFCIFTGSFTEHQLSDCLHEYKYKIKLNFVLSELHSCGFIDRSPYKFGEIYIFNSQIAKDYFKIGYHSKKFKKISPSIFEKQYKNNEIVQPHIAFLYGCLLNNNYTHQSKTFNSLAININYNLLLNEMNFLECVNKNITKIYRRELGILYDRTGNIKESRLKFKSLLIEALKEKNNLLAIESYYRLVQIDHTVYNKYNFKSCVLGSRFLKLQQEYWELHINMHKGIFLFEDFYKLLQKVSSICDKPNYDYLHLARRIYFDTYRVYYLEGSNETDKLLQLNTNTKEVTNYLKTNLNEFKLYYKKFSFLFLLAKDALYNLVLDETVIEKSVFDKFIKGHGIEYTDMSNIHKLLDICVNTCKELESEFERIGDKTFNFIRYYRTELLIIKGDPSTKALIQEYRDFGTDEIEYRLYAEFLELKYLISQYLNLKNISDMSEQKYNNLKLKVDSQFCKIENFFNKKYTNEYAIMRYKIYKILFSIITKNPNITNNIKDAMTLAQKNNYNREIKLLSKITEIGKNLSYGLCRNILLYYPIVPQ